MLESFDGQSPQIDATAYVHASAVLIGDVHIGSGASVWANASLRGDDGPIVIGAQSSIQDNSVIHCTTGLSATTVGERVTVGHSVVLHGCRIESDCLIGMGSILLDNAVIESGSIVAAGTLVPAGKTVKAGTVVMGNPMRVVRDVTPRDRGLIEFSWREYAKRVEDYRARDS